MEGRPVCATLIVFDVGAGLRRCTLLKRLSKQGGGGKTHPGGTKASRPDDRARGERGKLEKMTSKDVSDTPDTILREGRT